jgi:hypothetical protein
MKFTSSTSKGMDADYVPAGGIWAVGVVLLTLMSIAAACNRPSASPQAKVDVAGAAVGSAAQRADLAQRWGIEVTSMRLSAHNHMIDYRYRVLDADKAAGLFKRQIKPHLIHQRSGKVLAVPVTAKVGPLRNSNIPKQGKIYWMFFGNAGKLVKPGDKVTIVIGDFRAENLVVG